MSERILIVDPRESVRDSLLLASCGSYEVTAAASREEALRVVETGGFEIVLCAADWLDDPRISSLSRRCTLMAIAGDDEAVENQAIRSAFAVISRPIDRDLLLATLRQASERERMRRENRLLRRELTRTHGERPIIAASTSMIELLDTLEQASSIDTPVLLVGERGTGKEVLARAIHSQSPRRQRNFVAVHCGSMSEHELSIEIFGQTGTAVRGDNRSQHGLISDADGGTLFLDELGALSPALQRRLLETLTDGEYRPLGSAKSIAIDVRILAATARRLEAEVDSGDFDKDLLYRLNAVRLEAPALRDRRKDIPLLVDHFIERFQKTLGSPVRGVADDALERLVTYDWPGNIRELENTIERAVLLNSGDRIALRDLPTGVVRPDSALGRTEEDLGLKRARRLLETEVIRRALRATGGNRTHAAKRLEISHRALLYKLKEYGIRD